MQIRASIQPIYLLVFIDFKLPSYLNPYRLRENMNLNLQKSIYTKLIIFVFVFIIISSLHPISGQDPEIVETKIDSIIALMTLEEKIDLCHANSKFTIPGVPRLGIPELDMTDGPHSIKYEFERDSWASARRTDDSSSYLPCGVCLGATWNPKLAREYGNVLGEEARYRKKDVHLAPGLNIIRRPLCGRNFEYISEDPLLIKEIGVEYIKGVQQNDVASCIKHFIAYNDKRHPNVWMSERTLHEIYLPAFKAAIHEAGAMAIMGSYNKFKGEYLCQNSYMLNYLLKERLNFKGAVISDWNAVHNTYGAVYNGLDIEMGNEDVDSYDNFYMADPFLELAREKMVSEKLINDKVRRILRLYFMTSLKEDRPSGEFVTQEHFDFALKAAEEGIILLKNKNEMLPVDLSNYSRIAVIGDNATRIHNAGGGSSGTKALYEITPLQGIKNIIDEPSNISFTKGYKTKDSENADSLQKEAIKLASQSELVIYIGGLNHNHDTEIKDKESFQLPYNQDNLIKKLVAANPNLITVMLSGSSFDMKKWIDDVPNLMLMGYAGMEGGNALANVLTGKVNPSGKLSYTFPKNLKDAPEYAFNCFNAKEQTDYYKESVFVGYRYYDSYDVATQFEFGFGLSYTDFDFGKVQLNKSKINANQSLTARIEITNTGNRAGAEVAQVYIGDLEASVKRPAKELKAFQKVFLKANESKIITFEIKPRDLKYFAELKKEWVLEPGRFKIYVGNSVQNIKSVEEFEVI